MSVIAEHLLYLLEIGGDVDCDHVWCGKNVKRIAALLISGNY